jgi:hypothetical protein
MEMDGIDWWVALIASLLSVACLKIGSNYGTKLAASRPGTIRREIFTRSFSAETAEVLWKCGTYPYVPPKKMAEINAQKSHGKSWHGRLKILWVFPHFWTQPYICKQVPASFKSLKEVQQASARISTVAPRFQSSNSCSWRQLLMTRPEVCLEIVDRTWCVSCDGLGCFRPSIFDGRFVLGTACGTQGTRELWHHRMYQWKSCGRRMLSKIILDIVAYHPAKGCSIPYPHSCWLNPLFWWKCLSGLSEHEDRVTASESNGKRSSSAACYMKSRRRLRWIEMLCLKMMYTSSQWTDVVKKVMTFFKNLLDLRAPGVLTTNPSWWSGKRISFRHFAGCALQG